jgi:Sortilin, neurotensin receptor 3,/BNR/Asp-box repeat
MGRLIINMFMQIFARRAGRGTYTHLMLAGMIIGLTLAFAGCDATSLLSQQCTAQTCDYVVNQLVAVSGPNGPMLLADSAQAIYQYGGSSWQKIGDENASVRGPLLASPNFANDHTLFLGNSRSTDGGKTWQLICMTATAVSPNFATDKLVFGIDPNPNPPADASGTPQAKPTGCPSSTGSFYASQDNGQTWNAITGPSGAGDPDQFVISPTYKTDRTVFATFTVQLNSALYRSTDGGQSWQKIQDGRKDLIAISPNYASDKTVVALDSTALHISTDAGNTWKQLSAPIGASKIKEVAFSPTFSQDKTIVLVSASVDTSSSEASGTFSSTDSGATWTKISALTQRGQNYPALLFSPNYASDKTIYTASLDSGKGPALSTNLGQSWNAINTGLTLQSGLGG